MVPFEKATYMEATVMDVVGKIPQSVNSLSIAHITNSLQIEEILLYT